MKEGWALFLHSLRVFRKHPVFIIPILITWCAYAPSIIYLKYFFPWVRYSMGEDLAVVFLEIFLISLLVLASSTLMLEMIRQMELGQRPSLLKATGRLVGKDMVRVIPLALIWAITWFILTIIEMFLRRRKDDDSSEFNAENVAKTLADYREFSWGTTLIRALEKGVRLIVFLILPAIVWEGMNLRPAVKKGFAVLKAHVAAFVSGYALTYAAAAVIFLPPTIMFKLGTGRHGNPPLIVFPTSVWVGVIIYIGLAWSFCMYLEQMFMASIYFWQMNWEKAAVEARAHGERVPKFKEVPLPALLDLPELKL